MKIQTPIKRYGGLVLIITGTILLVLFRVAGWQSNAELLTGLALVLVGYILHLWLQKQGEKY